MKTRNTWKFLLTCLFLAFAFAGYVWSLQVERAYAASQDPDSAKAFGLAKEAADAAEVSLDMLKQGNSEGAATHLIKAVSHVDGFAFFIQDHYSISH